ncbi:MULTISPECIES: hypothetical protein [unclassified Kitasatospora]|uniref:hypothetical protein n=1 Tax=unclassified Kitasatospora TaxID=2633591 RepID=UPI0037F3AA67
MTGQDAWRRAEEALRGRVRRRDEAEAERDPLILPAGAAKATVDRASRTSTDRVLGLVLQGVRTQEIAGLKAADAGGEAVELDPGKARRRELPMPDEATRRLADIVRVIGTTRPVFPAGPRHRPQPDFPALPATPLAHEIDAGRGLGRPTPIEARPVNAAGLQACQVDPGRYHRP